MWGFPLCVAMEPVASTSLRRRHGASWFAWLALSCVRAAAVHLGGRGLAASELQRQEAAFPIENVVALGRRRLVLVR